MAPTPVLLPGKAHGQGSLVGCSPWGHREWDTTERLHFDFSLSCIGEGNGNPLQCSCLENGLAQSRTRLKRLSSSSNTAKDGEERKEQSIPCRKIIAGTKIFGMAVTKCEERVTWDLLSDLEGH